jgi:cobalt/nickel transport system permease protein
MTLAFDLPQQRDSFMRRLDPRWKLASLLAAAALTASLRSLPASAAAASAALILAVLARLPVAWYLGRLSQVLSFLTLFCIWLPFTATIGQPAWELGPVSISVRGTVLAGTVVLKAVALFTVMLVLLASAPLNATLKAAHALYFPAPLVHIVLLTYRYLFLLNQELKRLRIALRVRGYRNTASLHSYRTIGHVAGTLLVRSTERAERVGQAMRCRGFDGRFRALTTFRTRASDLIFFVATTGGAGLLIAWDLTRE